MANESTTLEKQEAEQVVPERTRSGQFYLPNVDILETQDELTVLADMPGVKADEIDVRLENGELSIYGPVPPRYDDRAVMLLHEYGIGDFYRTFRISEKIDAAKISAEYRQGVLTLHLPKFEAAKPRKILVQTS
jgi:HSP20 family protein